MERARRKGWSLVALDLGVDTSTPSGEMLANVLAVFAQFERRLIGQRTKDALAAKREAGTRLGRPPTLPAEVRERIRQMRDEGSSYRAIAGALNEENVATAHGGQRWYPATVRKVALAA
jgi:DNA invertase Pin-like site-specific DNA recombinase